MDARPTASIPITRPHLPPLERFSAVVADVFASRMLSNFAKYTGLLESRAAAWGPPNRTRAMGSGQPSTIAASRRKCTAVTSRHVR